jgi:predicted phage terminase large subunit-like protein
MPATFNPASFDPASVDAEAQLLDLDRADCEDSLYLFLKNAWHIFDSAPWVDGWCVEAIAEHLQAVVDGEIKRLIINIPPRCQKSSLCSVALPAWVWAQRKNTHTSGPGVSFLYASFKDSLSLRDSRHCRKVIESKWYSRRWGDRFKLEEDQNTKERFVNDKGGYRLITSIDSKGATGDGSNLIIIDDGNSAREVESEAIIDGTIDWLEGTVGTRLNNQRLGAIVEIQQRLGERDITGHLLSKNKGEWTTLVLPMKFEAWRKSYVSPIGWSDPRTEEGQLLWPERFGDEEVKGLEEWMGPWRACGQLQQRPEPKGGGIILRDWWGLWEKEKWPEMDFILATLDTAFTSDRENDPSGMIVWGIFSGDVNARTTRIVGPDGEMIRPSPTYSEFAPRVMMIWAWTEHLELHELVKKTADACIKYKVDTLLIENKASGISVAQEIRRLYTREKFGVELFDPKSQDKTARLYSVQHLFAEGIIYAPSERIPWVDAVITQVATYPKARHDEFVDLTSMGLRKLRDMGLLVRQPEREADLEESRQYRSREQPLYAV